MLRKTIRLMDKTVDRIVAILCLLFFLICIYAMVDAYNVYRNANDKSVLKYKPELGADPAVLRELSEDAVAWITIDDTGIDYPIMQGRSNDEYINKDPYGQYSLSGSIFLDSRNDRYFGDEYSLVYGHHMEYGAMFGALDNYKDPQYFNEHRTGTLISEGGAAYHITLFSKAMVQADDPVVFVPDERSRAEVLDYLKNHADIYLPQDAGRDSDHLIALSTCQSAENIERLVIFGVLSEIPKDK